MIPKCIGMDQATRTTWVRVVLMAITVAIVVAIMLFAYLFFGTSWFLYGVVLSAVVLLVFQRVKAAKRIKSLRSV